MGSLNKMTLEEVHQYNLSNPIIVRLKFFGTKIRIEDGEIIRKGKKLSILDTILNYELYKMCMMTFSGSGFATLDSLSNNLYLESTDNLKCDDKEFNKKHIGSYEIKQGEFNQEFFKELKNLNCLIVDNNNTVNIENRTFQYSTDIDIIAIELLKHISVDDFNPLLYPQDLSLEKKLLKIAENAFDKFRNSKNFELYRSWHLVLPHNIMFNYRFNKYYLSEMTNVNFKSEFEYLSYSVLLMLLRGNALSTNSLVSENTKQKHKEILEKISSLS